MTIQSNRTPEREQRPIRGAERKAELVCRVKYNNTLPDIPFDPKFIQYPFEANRFISYKPTTLERNYKYEVLTEHDLGVTVDLVDRDVFNVEPGATLDPADEKLLEEDILTPQDSKRSRHHARNVSWLRRTEYISTEQTRFQPQTMEKVEARVGYSIKKNFKEDTVIMDRDSQIRAIQKTFADSLLPIEKHYSKPNVYPVEILPVFPDFQGWKYPCAQVMFDSDPAPVGRSVPAQLEEMSQAMIRGVMDESGEQFVAYFLPTEETLEKRRQDVVNNVEYEDDQEYEYKMAREYNWNVKNKASKGYEENYFLVVRQDGIYYNELETRVRLSKRRQKPGQAPSNTRLVVKHRPVNEMEYRMQRYRERQLEPVGEDEEEEEEEPEIEQETITITRAGERTQGDSGDEAGSGSDRNGSDNESGKESNSDDDRRKRDEDSGSEKGNRKSRSRSSSAGSRKSKGSASSRSRSRSASAGSKKSRSRSGSAASRRSRSRSGSAASKASRSRSGSRTSNKSRSRSGSAASNRSGSAASNKTKSRSGSPASNKSKSRSPSAVSDKSRSRSPASNKSRSRSGSPASNKSRSVSPASNKSGSASPASNKSGRRSGTPASRKSRSRSPSAASNKSGSGSGSPGSAKSAPSRKSKSRSRSRSSSSGGSGSRSASPGVSNRSGSGSESD